MSKCKSCGADIMWIRVGRGGIALIVEQKWREKNETNRCRSL